MRDGFIVVYQDVRGRWMSGGAFEHMRPLREGTDAPRATDESTDAWDTVAWLLTHVDGHNGRVGLWGISYPGFYALSGAVSAHPAVRAVSPQAPIVDWFGSDDWHHNGALLLAHAFTWFAGSGWPFATPASVYPGPPFTPGTNDGFAFFLDMGGLRNAEARYFKGRVPFWRELMTRDRRDDWWAARDIRPHLRDVRPAVLAVGGWYDAENLFGTLETYAVLKRESPATVSRLVMGPWVHGGWSTWRGDTLGPIEFGAPTSEDYQRRIELPFLDHHLKDGPAPGLPEASAFETGVNRWRAFTRWPPPAFPQVLYLRAGALLATEPPGRDERPFDEYRSDPASPVPYSPVKTIGVDAGYMVADQRFVEGRPDVLTYRTVTLDAAHTVAGPVTATLRVSTTGTDADWVVKLIDVHPDGYAQLVRGDVMRGKFRSSLSRPEPFVPGRPTSVSVVLPDVFHTFRPGHRLMLQVQSSWFPLIDRNPQRFMSIAAARPRDFVAATQRVYHGADGASSVTLPLLREPATDLFPGP